MSQKKQVMKINPWLLLFGAVIIPLGMLALIAIFLLCGYKIEITEW